jgi:hypothetical protein
MIEAGNEISDSYTIQVGHVERSNISTLSITNVTKNPENPTTEIKTAKITADITSNVSIKYVKILYYIFTPSQGIKVANIGGSYSDDNNSYTFKIPVSQSIMISSIEDIYSTKGTKVFYKIVAKDILDNTAVTLVYSFIIN